MSIVYFQNVRCSFPHIATPFTSQKFPGTPPMYGIDIVNLDPELPQVKEFMTLCTNFATETWKEHAQGVMQMIQNDRRARCYGMGREKINEKTMQPIEGYGQGFWINAKNKNRPQIIRADGQPATNDMEAAELARKIYGGCYVNVAVKPWVRTANRGFSCDLVAIQFAADGEAFGEGGTTDASGMFGAVQAAPAAMQAPAAQMPAAPFAQNAPMKMPWEQ